MYSGLPTPPLPTNSSSGEVVMGLEVSEASAVMASVVLLPPGCATPPTTGEPPQISPDTAPGVATLLSSMSLLGVPASPGCALPPTTGEPPQISPDTAPGVVTLLLSISL